MRKQTCFMLLAIFFGMLGGFLFNYFTKGSTALASKNKKVKILEAQEFRIVDKNGKIRGKFALLFDEYPALVMRHKGGDTGITLGIAPNGLPNLSFADERLVRVDFGFIRETKSTKMLGIRLYDKNGKPRAVFCLDSDGIPMAILSDKKGMPRLGCSVASSDNPNITLWSKAGKMIWTAP